MFSLCCRSTLEPLHARVMFACAWTSMSQKQLSEIRQQPDQICSNGTKSLRYLCCSFCKGCMSRRTAWHHPPLSYSHPPRGWGDSGERFLTGAASVRRSMGAPSELPFAGPSPLPTPELHSVLLVGETGLHYKGKISPNCLLKKGPSAVFH